jgi:hypothetical protein
LQTKYNLGNTNQAKSPEQATEVFLRREFPQFLQSTTQPHDSVFIPDSFIYGGIAAKVFRTFFKEKIKQNLNRNYK